MKKAEFWKGFGAGFTVLLVLICLCVTAFASSKRIIDAVDGVGISINGATFIPKDTAESQVSMFTYNGIAYAPVRAIGEAMGLDVKFDSTSQMIQLTTQDRLRAQGVEFFAGSMEYEYEINAETGSIISRDIASTVASGGSAGNETISADRAKEIALADARISASDAVFKKTKLDRDDGRLEYEVEFYAGSLEYEYEINAETGSIISRDIASMAASGGSAGNETISADRAKEIALEDARISARDAVFKKAKFDRDDGRLVYEVEFYAGSMEYEYEINAETGSIISRDIASTVASGGSAGNETISADRAKEIALADARISANDAVFKKAKLDRDDGRLVYEVEFYADSMEYEYEINAETGSIISRDIEPCN